MKRHNKIVEEKHQYWQGHIEGWRQSGLGQAEYCRRNLLSIKNFGYWKRKQSKSELESVKFFPLVLQKPKQDPGSSSLHLTLQEKRFSIEIREDFSPALLKRVILTLEEMRC